ncbi:MAG: hypothetical protein UIG59_07380 [Acutalibacteraceae bacterium]|nr:hypothetical protein [Acutalibacteraceae bacterium]
MKKYFFPLLLVICLMLTACSSSAVKPQLCGISFRAEMTYYNENYSLEGELGRDKTLKATITSPEELKDLNFTITPSGTTVEYKGISYTPVEGSMPFSALMDKFYRAMLDASQEGLTANSDGILTLDAEGKKTEFTLSPTGLPLEAQIENGNFLIKFYNVTIKEDTDG